jgi:hypothetical protein
MFESFLDLNLDLSANAISIEEALVNFIKIETLDSSMGYKCDKYNSSLLYKHTYTLYLAVDGFVCLSFIF